MSLEEIIIEVTGLILDKSVWLLPIIKEEIFRINVELLTKLVLFKNALFNLLKPLLKSLLFNIFMRGEPASPIDHVSFWIRTPLEFQL